MSVLLALAISFTGQAFAQRAPQASEGLTPARRERALFLADLLMEEKRWEEAEQWIRERMALDPEQGPWRLRLAQLLSSRGDPAQALAMYQELLKTNANDAGLLLELGRQARLVGRDELAEEAWLKARAEVASPELAYLLADLYWGQRRDSLGNKWAKTAVQELEFASAPRDLRLKLHLQARIQWRDRFDDEFGALFDRSPGDDEILGDWARALLRAGLPQAASEPIALLTERFPAKQEQKRSLEYDRLRLLGRDDEAGLWAEESLCRFPESTEFMYSAGESRYRKRDWACAEAFVSSAAARSVFAAPVRDYLRDIREEHHHFAGPFWRWNGSDSAEFSEFGAAYRGAPVRGTRAELEAAFGRFKTDGAVSGHGLSGLYGSWAVEKPRWKAGPRMDFRTGGGLTTFALGAYGDWLPSPDWSVRWESWLGRLWREQASALAAGVRRNELQLQAAWRASNRLRLSATTEAARFSARGGGKASQVTISPQASWTLTDAPFYSALTYQFIGINAAPDALFASQLGLTDRMRAHFTSLSAAHRWLDGRLRGDAYVFNGHEPARGRKWTRGDLVGFGLDMAYYWTDDWILRGGYQLMFDGFAGVNGRNHRSVLSVERRWGPAYSCSARCTDAF